MRFHCLRFVALLTGASLVALAPSTETASAPRASAELDLAQVESRLVDLANAFRKKEGRLPLKDNEELSRTARYFADFMAGTDKYGHTADGKEPAERAKEHGYAYCIIAENIAWELKPSGFDTASLAESLFTGWKNSPEHRANMLDPDVSDVGIAVAHGEKSGRYYGVQEFGRPRSRAISFEIVNRANGSVRYTVDGEDFTLPVRYTRTHRACRPPTLAFRLGAGKDDKRNEAFKPADGARYVVREGRSGPYIANDK